MMFDTLFSPVSINSLEVKNRIVYPGLGLLYSYDGKLNDRYYEYFREKARGGAGIVTVGPVGVDRPGSGFIMLTLKDDEEIPPFRKLTDIIRGEGARAWVQLFHAGGYSFSQLLEGEKPMAPSSVYSRYNKETPREMTLDDIRDTQEAFARAAERALKAGFDGIEIIASAGYLITQFLSPAKNLRTDEYGGSFENRVRFPRETIELVRQRIGPEVPLTIRMAGNDFVPGSNTDTETPAFAVVYEKAGVDAINVTGGWHESRVPQLPMEVPRAGYSYLAMNIKETVSVPVISSNRISSPFEAEKIIRDGMADMVCLGRVLIADPEWPEKAMKGREDEIRPCVACNQGCTDTIFSGKPVFCIVNPRAGYEGVRNIPVSDNPKNIMVIGAGPAGLEAAVRGTEAGHRVELYEKAGRIGGQLWIAGTPPHKQELWELIHYYESMLDRLEIPVHLETEVTMELIREKSPDFIISAEGAEIMVPPVRGIDGPDVLSAWDVLENDPVIGNRVAVIGGGAVGLETAHFLASKGTITPDVLYFLFRYRAESDNRLHELVNIGNKDITVFEMLPRIGSDVGKSTRWILLGNLERHRVKMVPGAKVISVHEGIVEYETDGTTSSMEFDTVINAAGSRPVTRIADSLKETGIEYRVIGDSAEPSRIDSAIHGAYLAIMELG